jgi:tRNA threonylcarbamoyladenosine biosynthesis protein TsaE
MASTPQPLIYESNSVEETRRFGRLLGECAGAGTVVGLIGPLGAGKTQFVKGIAAGLDVDDVRRVCSPTFVIVREHPGRLRLYHVDAYRVGSADLAAVGFDEMCRAGGVVVAEWADRVSDLLPDDLLMITIELTGESQRRLNCRASGPRSLRLLDRLSDEIE